MAAAEPPVVPSPAPNPAASPEELALLLRGWGSLLDRVGKTAMLARASLIDARPTEVTQTHVVIGFDPEFAAEVENFQVPRNRKAVEQALHMLLKRNVHAEFKVWDSAPPALDIELLVVRDGDPESMESDGGDDSTGADDGTRAKTIGEWARDPAVKQVLEVFNGTIINVRQ